MEVGPLFLLGASWEGRQQRKQRVSAMFFRPTKCMLRRLEGNCVITIATARELKARIPRFVISYREIYGTHESFFCQKYCYSCGKNTRPFRRDWCKNVAHVPFQNLSRKLPPNINKENPHFVAYLRKISRIKSMDTPASGYTMEHFIYT